jgi:hypothetical protein
LARSSEKHQNPRNNPQLAEGRGLHGVVNFFKHILAATRVPHKFDFQLTERVL